MTEDIQRCVDARVNFFDEYFTVPDDVRPDVDGFIREITALGEGCGSATDFEARFAAEGLSDSFNALLPKCTPKPRKMTKEEKKQSRQIFKQMISDNKEQIIEDAANDIIQTARVHTSVAVTTARREHMIENGTMADYTIARNKIEAAGTVGRFLKGLFKK